MKCFNCGCSLSEKSFCTSCGADVALYKKIIITSNRFYNDGLEKANVRDLSGAVISLRQSLKLNKNNIEARNLLGLVNFEMGDAVAALSEWVISKNFRPKKNIADDYIAAVQNNASRLETINQAVKKYNKSLDYCKQGSCDLAVIQLKKVLSLNPNLLKGRQLLALLYMHNEEWEKARKELIRCTKIDANNTMTLRYLREVKVMLEGDEESGNVRKKKNIADDVLVYQSGNETIIQPLNVKDPVKGSNILNIVIGLVVGIAVCWFLILPMRIQNAEAGINEKLKEVSAASDAKTATIEDLQQRFNSVSEEKKKLEKEVTELSGPNGAVTAGDYLMSAAADYLNNANDTEKVADSLLKIDTEFLEKEASEVYKQLYQDLINEVGPKTSKKYFDDGTLAMNQNDFTKAIENLEKAWYFNKTDSSILYQLAQAYRMAEDNDKARAAYEQVIELFPGTQSAGKAKEYLEDASSPSQGGEVRNNTHQDDNTQDDNTQDDNEQDEGGDGTSQDNSTQQ